MQYDKLRPRLSEAVFEILKLSVVILAVAYVFYDTLSGIIAGIPVAVFLFLEDEKKRKKRIKSSLLMDFKSVIMSVDSALSAGMSLERALEAALGDMRLLYPSGCYMERELSDILRKVKLHIPVAELFSDLGKRSGVEEIRDFATILSVAEKTGGNLIKIIRKSVINISSKIDTKREIEVMVAAKKMEHNIMSVMPLIIILYMKLTNYSYMAPLYGNVPGAVFMSICIIFICLAHYIGGRIVDIEV